MRVDLFSIGHFTLHSYGLMIAVGIVLCVIMGMRRAGKFDLKSEPVLDIAIVAAIFGFLGAKLLFVIEYLDEMENPWSVISSEGFVVYGGIILGVVAVIVYCAIRKLSFFRYFDLLMPSVALAQGFGRIGCFFAGCCYGAETDLPIGIVFPEGSFAPAGVSLIPTQLFSAAGNFVICLVLIVFAKRSRTVGDVGALYLLLYGIGRFAIEFFRENLQGWVGPFTTAQCFSLVFVAAAVLLFIRNHLYVHADTIE